MQIATLEHALALWLVCQHSTSAYRQLIAHFGDSQSALAAGPNQWQALPLHPSHSEQLTRWHSGELQRAHEANLNQLSRAHVHILDETHPHYPKSLTQIDDAPPLLFVQGTLNALLAPQIALVGSRSPSPTGKQIALTFSEALTAQGFAITSGLAKGIDAAAHQGCLNQQGQTIAVLGNGILQCYPTSNQALFDTILAKHGAIVSEFLPNTAPLAYHFPRRNRIVSGLSLGVVVIEAAKDSGSLITARLAAEQGKLVFAVPGHIYNQAAKGCHDLIREGAILVDDPIQIIDDLKLPVRWHQMNQPNHMSVADNTQASTSNPENASLSETLSTLLAQIDWNGLPIDHLVETSGLPVAQLSGQLLELELLGYVVRKNGCYQRCRQF